MNPWPWEGAVQDVFADILRAEGWVTDRLADTASHQHGIDVVAHKGDRKLGAEVKGFQSKGYTDPNRAGTKKATPNGQAKIAFGKAIHAALILHDKQPSWESLIVLPDGPRYRALVSQVEQSLTVAGVHVVLVSEDGAYACPTWSA